jgi:hypothetical protein
MAKKNEATIATINTLARAARPINDDDWGTERQINAENAFFAYAKERMFAGRAGKTLAPQKQKWADFEAYCLKATTDEMIDEALRLLGMTRAPGEKDWR